MKKNELIRMGVMAVGSIGILVLCVLVSGVLGSNTGARDVIALQNEVASREAADAIRKEEREAQIEAAESAGLDVGRVARDRDLAVGFLEGCMAWDSYAAYDAKRTQIMTAYRLADGSRFMSTFLPPRWSYPSEEDLARLSQKDRAEAIRMAETVPLEFGERTANRFGSNPTLGSLEPYVTGIGTDNTYSYVARVRWSNMGSDGAQHVYEDLFCYEITADGVLDKPDAYLAAGAEGTVPG